jgi:hypothetical protein
MTARHLGVPSDYRLFPEKTTHKLKSFFKKQLAFPRGLFVKARGI